MKNSRNTIRYWSDFFYRSLEETYGKRETEELFFYWVNALYGWKRSDLRAHLEDEWSENEIRKLEDAVDRLKNQEPIQYILGFTDFSGCRLAVDPAVLIPRPETEELVHELSVRMKKSDQQRILDLCSGSGCIALGLKKHLPAAVVYGVELSEDALALSRKNAGLNGLPIDFIKDDVLQPGIVFENGFDLIVSNPPYITEPEKTEMRRNVLDYEPHMALFTETGDALQFYKAIIQNYSSYLVPGGLLAFEINEKHGYEISQLLGNTGEFSSMDCLKDMQGKDRFIIAVKN